MAGGDRRARRSRPRAGKRAEGESAERRASAVLGGRQEGAVALRPRSFDRASLAAREAAAVTGRSRWNRGHLGCLPCHGGARCRGSWRGGSFRTSTLVAGSLVPLRLVVLVVLLGLLLFLRLGEVFVAGAVVGGAGEVGVGWGVGRVVAGVAFALDRRRRGRREAAADAGVVEVAGVVRVLGRRAGSGWR